MSILKVQTVSSGTSDINRSLLPSIAREKYTLQEPAPLIKLTLLASSPSFKVAIRSAAIANEVSTVCPVHPLTA